MLAVNAIFFFDWNIFQRLDILAWVIGIPIVVAALVWLYVQRKQTALLREELSQLTKIKRHPIEYELVLKTMKLAIWRMDVATRVVTFDCDYRDATDSIVFPSGAKLDDVVNMMMPAYVDHFVKSANELITGRTDQVHGQYEMRIPHTDRVYWSETYAAIEKRDLKGNPLTVVGTTIRIDRQKRAERELIDARNHAEESDRMKTAFLANISHEVRTPLNAIVGFSNVLPMVKNEEERAQLITLIQENNAQLLRLFDDLVHMSRLEAGGGSVKKTRFKVKTLLAEIMEEYSQHVDASHVTLFIAHTDSALEVFTDRDRLAEILRQYVDNAVKATTEGEIVIGAEKQELMLHVWVKDTGKGIPEEHLNEHLFERFVKVDEFVPGTGIGLSICRSMALSLGGKVGMKSALGEGSLFWADIPIE